MVEQNDELRVTDMGADGVAYDWPVKGFYYGTNDFVNWYRMPAPTEVPLGIEETKVSVRLYQTARR